jgi:tryptophan synthase alpha chain
MNSITETFVRLRGENKTALMPFLVSGYPNENTFIKLLKRFEQAGADLIEIGIPFSDPLADGKTIQAASRKMLEKGNTIDRTFHLLSKLHNYKTPLILMSYFNPILHYGIESFLRRAFITGVRGLIIPDIIPEEGGNIARLCTHHNIDLIYLLAPTSDSTRRQLIINKSHGFIYLVSLAGVTGARKALPARLARWIRKIKKESRLPVCVGFGISGVPQARALSEAADGIIIGSAIIDKINATSGSNNIVRVTGKFISQLRKGIDHV